MFTENKVTHENFNALLRWLDYDRDLAGEKYEKIRKRLIWIFTCRGCFEAEELADETINRVTSKLPQIINNYIGDPTLYFCGVANKVHLEWLRRQKKIKNLEIIEEQDSPNSELDYECLEKCLEKLPAEQRKWVVVYYTGEKSDKIQFRKQLAEELGINANALQVRMHRLRASLQGCVENCVAGK